MFKNVLVAVDGYAPSLGAAVRAVEMARHNGIRVTALQVIEEVPLLHEEADAEALVLKGEDSGPLVEDPLAVVKAFGLSRGVDITTLTRSGHITAEILEAAEETQADLIIVGDSGLKGLQKLYFGSVARAVAENAHSAVMIVKKGTTDISEIVATPIEVPPAVEVAAPGRLEPGTLMRKMAFAGTLLAIFTLIYFGSALMASAPFSELAASDLLGVPLAIWAGWSTIVVGVVITRIFLVRMLQEEAAERG